MILSGPALERKQRSQAHVGSQRIKRGLNSPFGIWTGTPASYTEAPIPCHCRARLAELEKSGQSVCRECAAKMPPAREYPLHHAARSAKLRSLEFNIGYSAAAWLVVEQHD